MSVKEISNRWPHIGQFLRGDNSTGWVDDDYPRFWRIENRLAPAERAAALDEWADFYEWQLTQRADELATDHVKRHLVTEWTDSMAYSCRRSAALARGEDPGEWVPLSTRRPDIATERRAIVTEIVTSPNPRDEPAEQLTVTG